MKKLLLLTLLLPITSTAQITLNVNDFADGGDTVRMSTANDPGLDFTLTGPNYAWDFTTLVASSQELKDFKGMSDASTLASILFGMFQPPKYQASNFASSTDLPLDQLTSALPISITDINLFSKNTADSITSVGYSVVVQGTEIPFQSDTIETRYKFPLNYGDTYTSRGYSELDMNPVYDAIWRQHKQRNVEVDGWGIITTPYGAFDALRIKHEISEIDSIMISFSGISTWIPLQVPASTVYEWWTSGELEPVLRVEMNTVAGTPVVRKIEFRDSYDPLLAGLSEESIQIGVFPNPTTNELVVRSSAIGVNYIIVGSDGAICLKGIINSTDQTIDVSRLVAGNYTILVAGDKGVTTETFVKH